MKQANDFLIDMLDFDTPEAGDDTLWRACRPTEVKAVNGDVYLTIPFQAQKKGLEVEANSEIARKEYKLRVRAYGDSIMRLSIAFGDASPDDGDSISNSPMLEMHASLTVEPLTVQTTNGGWEIRDSRDRLRMWVNLAEPPIKMWSNLQPPPDETLDLELFPDGKTSVPLMAYDQFFPQKHDSMVMAFVERAGVPQRALFSFHAQPNEKFTGTGERFARLDLAGRTFILENTDGLGVNSRRAYKNIPFYLTSRPYGLFIHSSAHMRLSLADISTRAAQGLVEEPGLDLFVIGGGTVEQVMYNYRRLTGFPQDVPLWSYGTWMSRMTYFSAEEVRTVAQKLRQGDFPCDVLHLDTGWFAKDWVCEWEFSRERFPDPETFIKAMRKDGYRITLWQMPNLGLGNKLFEMAVEKGYVAPNPIQNEKAISDFSAQMMGGRIDFSNPEAVAWYQSLLERLLKMGVAAIKTDFGEDLHFDADYQMPAAKLHNLYALLYQQAAYEITQKTTGEGLIWARASWAGSQRYPLHWGGDSACTWDGLAGSLRGGLRALIFHHEDDPTCWHIDDQYYFGDAFLVAPIINSEGVRDVYLPAGQWVDFWTGERLEGSCWLKQIKMPLEHLPIYVKASAQIPIYPHPVQCSDEMDLTQVINLTFDDSYQGISNSVLGGLIEL